MRKRTPRQHLDPMGWIKQRTPLAEDQQRDICIAYRASLQAMLRGHGTEQTWSTLACSFNIALILAEQGIAAAAIPTIKLAQEALLHAGSKASALPPSTVPWKSCAPFSTGPRAPGAMKPASRGC